MLCACAALFYGPKENLLWQSLQREYEAQDQHFVLWPPTASYWVTRWTIRSSFPQQSWRVQQSVKLIQENSIFVSVNTTIQVKLITKVIYFNVNHDMFNPYCVIIGCISVYLHPEFLFNMDLCFSSYLTIWLCEYCLVVNLWFVYSLALSRIGIKVY
jgi:hypothetical protein